MWEKYKLRTWIWVTVIHGMRWRVQYFWCVHNKPIMWIVQYVSTWAEVVGMDKGRVRRWRGRRRCQVGRQLVVPLAMRVGLVWPKGLVEFLKTSLITYIPPSGTISAAPSRWLGCHLSRWLAFHFSWLLVTALLESIWWIG